MRFFGNYEAKVDVKGRAFLPAQFRKVLSETATGDTVMVLRQDVFEDVLVLYPESVWDAVVDGMRKKLSRWDRREQMAFRTFVSSVVQFTLDSSGRILLPRTFLDAAGIKQSLRFVGMGDTIEIWADDNQPVMDKEEFEKMIEEKEKEINDDQNS